MAILDILHFPDARLRNVAKPVAAVDDGVRQLIDDMFETMYDAPGIGLAAITLKLCMQLYLDILRGRAAIDLPALSAALRQSGLSVLPAMTLVAVATGIILGQQTSRLLAELERDARVGAAADMVGDERGAGHGAGGRR